MTVLAFNPSPRGWAISEFKVSLYREFLDCQGPVEKPCLRKLSQELTTVKDEE